MHWILDRLDGMSLRSVALALLALTIGCEALHSDAENYGREQRAERARRLVGMKAATRQTARGADVAGDALTRLVSGRTHVFVYGVSPGGHAERYVEYSYFRPDAHFVYRNSQWAKNPEGRDGDYWRVDDARLCILNAEYASAEQCFRLAVQPDGGVQYYIDAPGAENDRLLTKITTDVVEGAPTS
jgi:hypothetical protein